MMHLMRDVYTFTDRPCLTEHRVQFTPTVPHCSMATLIGLCIRVKLLRTLAPRFKVDIQVGRGGGVGQVGMKGERAEMPIPLPASPSSPTYSQVDPRFLCL